MTDAQRLLHDARYEHMRDLLEVNGCRYFMRWVCAETEPAPTQVYMCGLEITLTFPDGSQLLRSPEGVDLVHTCAVSPC